MKATEQKSSEEKLNILLDWKKLYIQSLISHLHPKGSVLEVGFGNGLAADLIQKQSPKNHTIIESNPMQAAKAKDWASNQKNVTIIEGKWDASLSKLGTFDTIFFNDYTLEDDVDTMNFLFPENAMQASADAKKLLHDLEKQLSRLTTKFSDEEIEDFYKKIGKLNLEEMPAFFEKLRDNGNITKAQYDNAVKKFQLADHSGSGKNSKKDAPKKIDSMLAFLENGLEHLNIGGHFSAFLNSQNSRYEDSKFTDKVINNPHLEYKESSVQIKTPDQTREGLIILIEKK